MNKTELVKWLVANNGWHLINKYLIERFDVFKEQEKIQAMLTLQAMIQDRSMEESQEILRAISKEYEDALHTIQQQEMIKRFERNQEEQKKN